MPSEQSGPAASFIRALTLHERREVRSMSTPLKVQAFLDSIPYSAEAAYRSPLRVLRDRVAHCYDGAVFAAAALSLTGSPPLIVNMFPNSRDDEHLVALYRRFGGWGAVGKSNFVGLRFREPIHRTLRELMLSYFEQYYNVVGEKTLRSYTRPLNLRAFDRASWLTDDRAMEAIATRLSAMRRHPLVTRGMIASLSPVDSRSLEAGLQGSIAAGLYRP